MAHSVNPDLLKERKTATFNVERLTNLLDNGEDVTKRRRDIYRRALNEKVEFYVIHMYINTYISLGYCMNSHDVTCGGSAIYV